MYSSHIFHCCVFIKETEIEFLDLLEHYLTNYCVIQTIEELSALVFMTEILVC